MSDLPKPIGFIYSTMLFLVPGFIFWLHLTWTVPYLSAIAGIGIYASWVIVGTFALFLPLFVLTFYLLKKDNYSFN